MNYQKIKEGRMSSIKKLIFQIVIPVLQNNVIKTGFVQIIKVFGKLL